MKAAIYARNSTDQQREAADDLLTKDKRNGGRK
jgi:DNA invertase Pin-like site-specific DNA recombinase